MGFFLAALIFCICTACCFVFMAYLYFRLVKAVRRHKDVPRWMYKIGHALKEGRGTDSYEDITDIHALREVNVFFCLYYSKCYNCLCNVSKV